MANYIATDAQLTATADSIRAISGDSAALEWDASTGFADDIVAALASLGLETFTISDFNKSVGKYYKVDTAFSLGNDTTKAALASIAVSPGDTVVYRPIYDSNNRKMSCKLVERPQSGNCTGTSLTEGGIKTVEDTTYRVYFNFGYTVAQGVTMTSALCNLFRVYIIRAPA